MKLDSLLDIAELNRMLDEGYVARKEKGDLVLFSYTPKAQWDRVWNNTTLNCRGLICDRYTGEIIARPFAKFFNYGEPDVVIPEGPIRVTDKLDGSLGILYFDREVVTWKIATRGSFDSEQAVWATEWFNDYYGFPIDFRTDKTYLFEILYPENKIVVDYGGRKECVLLEILDNETGLPDTKLREEWFGPTAFTFTFANMEELLAMTPRRNAEGFVVYFEKTNTRLKVKYEEYVRLHKLVTNLTNKTIWEYLSQGKTIDDLIAGVPDEFYEWVRKEASRLRGDFDEMAWQVRAAFGALINKVGEKDRKAFARHACTHPFRAMLFLMYDDRDASGEIWKQLKPAKTEVFKREVE